MQTLADFRTQFQEDKNFCYAEFVDDKIIVYVKTMSSEVYEKYPDFFNGKRVILNYNCSRNISKNLYTTYIDFEMDYVVEKIKTLLHIYGARVMSSVLYEFQLNEKNMRSKYPHLDTEISYLVNRYSVERITKEFEDLRTPDVSVG